MEYPQGAKEQSKAFPAVTASFPSDSQAWLGCAGAGGCCHTHKAPVQLELEVPTTRAREGTKTLGLPPWWGNRPPTSQSFSAVYY